MVTRPAARAALPPSTPEEPGDEVLIARIISGSEEALRAMYDRHASIIFGSVLRLLRDEPDAEEIVQETFMTLWNRAGQFDQGRGSAKTWLLSIARNRALDRARARMARAQFAPFSSVMAGREEPGASDDWLIADAEPVAAGTIRAQPEDAVLYAETRAAISAAIDALEPHEREVILLAYSDQLSQSEVASWLDAPLGTVKTRTRAALRHLREALGEAATPGRAGNADRAKAAPSRALCC